MVNLTTIKICLVKFTVSTTLKWSFMILKSFYLFSFSYVDLWSCTCNFKAHFVRRTQLGIETILFNSDQSHQFVVYIHLLTHS